MSRNSHHGLMLAAKHHVHAVAQRDHQLSSRLLSQLAFIGKTEK